jgi:outer membrane protein, multidrug efflux system
MRTGLLLGLLPWLAGCSTSAHQATAPVPLPSQWTAADTLPGEVSGSWWNSFGDTNLTAIVEEALARNRDLVVAAARLDVAMAEARIAGADLAPSLGAGFDAARAQRNFIGLPIPGAGSRVLTSRSTTYGLNLNLSWELDLWGRIRSARRAALAEVMASDADLAGARQSIAGQTAKAWLATVEAARQAELAGATVRSYRETADLVRRRYESGLRPPLDLRLALASVESAEALLAERRNALSRLSRQLEILLGRYPAAQVTSAASLPGVPRAIPAGLPAELLSRRPDLAAAADRLRAADHRIAQAKAALYPRIALTASDGTSSSELTDLLSTGFHVWSLAGNVAQPFFQGGRLRAGVKRAEAQARQAVAAHEGAVLRALGEVESALAAESFLAESESRLQQALEQSRAARLLAEERYRQGLENFTTVLEAQRRALDTETQLVTVRRLRLDTRVDLHLALGGGFEPGARAAGRTINDERKGGS